MARSRPLLVEHLEDRTVLSTFGTPWPDAMRLSLSFAPDGTLIDGQTSGLYSTMAQLPTAAWQTEILRAFQTWAVNANINIGVVGDGGQMFGVLGAVEGDARFGDIRVGGRSFDTHIAMSSPFQVLTSTRAGDVLFGTGTTFGIGDPNSTDIYSVVLNEAGNVFGVADNLDPTSGAYAFYAGIRAGLSATDVAQLQALYGARLADEYEGATGNDSVLSATVVNTTEIIPDITTLTDVDYFSFTVPFGVSTFSVRVQAGEVSLLTPHLTVYDILGQPVASAVSTDPLNNTVVVQIDNAVGGATYHIKVAGSRADVFGIGSYRLRVRHGPASDMGSVVGNNDFSQGKVLNDAHTNDILAAATNLDRSSFQSDTRFDVRAHGFIRDFLDVDYYRFTTPDVTTDMTVLAWSVKQNGVDPLVELYDSTGTLVAADVLVNDAGSYVLKVTDVAPNSTYYARVVADNPLTDTTGHYVLSVTFGGETPLLSSAGAAFLDDTALQSWRTLNNFEGQVMHFVLSSSDTLQNAAVRMTVYDSNNNVVLTLLSKNGESASANVYLAAGEYTVRVEGGSSSGALESLFYDIRATGVTDPIDPLPADPNDVDIGVRTDKFGWVTRDAAYYSFLEALDQYENPFAGL